MADEPKISEESALEQIEELLEYYDVSKDDIETENGPEAVQTMTNGLIRAIRKGRLSMDRGEGGMVVTQTLVYPWSEDKTSIQYTDKLAKAKLAMDSVSAKRDQGKVFEFMAVMTNTPVSELLKLKGADMATYNRLTLIFSMV